jgi:hypothetical protein
MNKKIGRKEENKLGNKEDVIILGRSGMKYIDISGIEYFINSEMVINEEYDFVLYSNSIMFYGDYLKKHDPDNIILNETYNKKLKQYTGIFGYKNEFHSEISKEKIEQVINKVKELCLRKNIKIKID